MNIAIKNLSSGSKTKSFSLFVTMDVILQTGAQFYRCAHQLLLHWIHKMPYPYQHYVIVSAFLRTTDKRSRLTLRACNQVPDKVTNRNGWALSIFYVFHKSKVTQYFSSLVPKIIWQFHRNLAQRKSGVFRPHLSTDNYGYISKVLLL